MVTAVIPLDDQSPYCLSTRHATIKRMNTRELNPGLLSIFRLFTAIRLVLAVLFLLITAVGLGPHEIAQHSTLWLNLGESAFTLAYLSMPGLQKRLGKLYLPIALGISTLGPIISTLLTIDPATSIELG